MGLMAMYDLLDDKDLKLSKKLIIFNNEAKTIIFNTQITKQLNSNYYIKINYRNMINNILHERVIAELIC